MDMIWMEWVTDFIMYFTTGGVIPPGTPPHP
jgi:hypothetical protein